MRSEAITQAPLQIGKHIIRMKEEEQTLLYGHK